MQVREHRSSRRQDVLARARMQRLTADDLAQAQELDTSAEFIADGVRSAAQVQPGKNLDQLEHLRLAFGYEAGEIPLTWWSHDGGAEQADINSLQIPAHRATASWLASR